MAVKYLDYAGLSYFWGKLKGYFVAKENGKGLSTNDFTNEYKTALDNLDTNMGTKADKVASATNGNFAGLDANGNLTDSGSKAADFKTVQNAVADPSASGTGLTFIATLSQDTNGVISATKQTVANVTASISGQGGTNGLMLATDKEKIDGISAGANKVEQSATNGNIKIDNTETTVYTLPGTVVQTVEGTIPTSVLPVIPAEKLPSYVDDVIEAYPVASATELTDGWLAKDAAGTQVISPEAGKIYILMADSTTHSTNTQFRWATTTYVKLSDGGVSSISNGEIDSLPGIN